MGVPYNFGHANQWFMPSLRNLVANGDRVVARGRATREYLHVTTRLPDPRKRVVTVPFRRANPFFQLAETVWILGGRSDAAWITYYNSQLKQFLDDVHEHFHGAYGERLRRWGDLSQRGVEDEYPIDQLKDIITQLQVDRGSRRAVAVLHNPQIDGPEIQTKDRPCNIALSCQIRDGALWMATFNRSNDLVLGLSYTNLTQFTVIQEFLASALNVKLGEYTHFSSSYHVYEDDPIAQRLLAWYGNDTPVIGEYDVYSEHEPVPMTPWPSDDPNYGWNIIDGLLSPTMTIPHLAEDVYWPGVVSLMIAWVNLKSPNPADLKSALWHAVDEIFKSKLPDWSVACLEFVHRWACRRGFRDHFLALLMDHRREMDFSNRTIAYITHDDLTGDPA